MLRQCTDARSRSTRQRERRRVRIGLRRRPFPVHGPHFSFTFQSAERSDVPPRRGGVAEAALLVLGMGAERAGKARALACRLYPSAERERWTDEAHACNIRCRTRDRSRIPAHGIEVRQPHVRTCSRSVATFGTHPSQGKSKAPGNAVFAFSLQEVEKPLGNLQRSRIRIRSIRVPTDWESRQPGR